MQLHEYVVNGFDLVIDLHLGKIDEGMAAEIYCGDIRLTDRFARLYDGHIPVNFYLITDKYEEEDLKGVNICHTIIPRKVWGSKNYIYTGETSEKFIN